MTFRVFSRRSLEMKRLLTIFAVIASWGSLWSQVSKEGSPLSWNSGLVAGMIFQHETLPPLNSAQLLQEDMANAGFKGLPFRFAQRVEVDFSTDRNGEWRNLANGDRIWLLSLHCENALALSVEFSRLILPPGGSLYLYNGSRSDFAGPFTHRHSREHIALGTAPLGGNTLVIEYYEPFAGRGHGEVIISSVARSYRDINTIPVFPGSDCAVRVYPGENSLAALSDAVLLIMTDHGQRALTGTLINNTRHDGSPYVLTAIQGLIGDPESLVFVQGVKQGCSNGEVCWDKFLSGASIVHQNPSTGITLLKLLEAPSRSWSSYVAGWSLREPQQEWHTSLQHAFGAPLTASRYLGRPIESTWLSFSSLQVGEWNLGNTYTGSLGSPLFNARNELVGVFTGGGNTCAQSPGDHFGSLSHAWAGLGTFLDPMSENTSALPGFYPVFERDATNTNSHDGLVIFPNPAIDRIYVQNESDEPINELVLRDAQGRLSRQWTPDLPYVEVSDLPAGLYILTIRQNTRASHHQVVIR